MTRWMRKPASGGELLLLSLASLFSVICLDLLLILYLFFTFLIRISPVDTYLIPTYVTVDSGRR
ncbi:uncharacterized protein BO80DRAFT_125416 [Aspergillus ibericus CBS 121593]|uniref:Uncharacterized protein n=1 Tax=Aspergillus ibericus CBS 121593 TaxID=1448316 RepID=A0A395GZP3_9EURO|nr:hypothetical protein BO80DRAFT_125416 [Aspergillus ibericus CBS 121593]RAK99503.1 hypothetical protein BO80DRAFT_125416 [Aspergillus ibericus CBS 121593]